MSPTMRDSMMFKDFINQVWSRPYDMGAESSSDSESRGIRSVWVFSFDWSQVTGSYGLTYDITRIGFFGAINTALAGKFYQDFGNVWGGDRAKIMNGGQLMTLSLDKASGSGFQSKTQRMYGKFDMQMKFVPGNSAGTVTTCYGADQRIMRSIWSFLATRPGSLICSTRTSSRRGKETGSNSSTFGSTQPRTFTPTPSSGILVASWPTDVAICKYWDVEDWATRGGLGKMDWSQAPFTAAYRNFNSQACAWPCTCSSTTSTGGGGWFNQELDVTGQQLIKWAQSRYIVCNYCTDHKRFPQGVPPECAFN
ncbi:Xyloglucan endotransglucosylase protein 1-like protein [Drosera capensis]